MNRQESSLKNYKRFRTIVEGMPMPREMKDALWQQWGQIGWFEKH